MQYSNFIEVNGNFYPSERQPVVGNLPAGVYELKYDGQTGQMWFARSKITSDTLLDLPSKEYSQVVSEIGHFLKPATRTMYERFGYIYKRSTLLYGVPGTGKTCIANRIAQKVVEQGGVVIFNPQLLPKAFEVLDSVQPNITTMVIFEELDQLLKKHSEGSFLSLLDGEVQKENVIYVATTNFIEKIPARIRRPGRFSTVLEVQFPSADSRRFYLNHKGVDANLIEPWVSQTEGLSIDELKETVLAVYCLNQKLGEIIERLGKNKNLKTIKSVPEQDAVVWKMEIPRQVEESETGDTDEYENECEENDEASLNKVLRG